MKLLVNCSNLKIGGGIQVALSFINESRKFTEHSYCIIVHDKIYFQLNLNDYSCNYKFINHNFERKNSCKFLTKAEHEYNPDVVFTIFGPSYWKPKSAHLMGFARGHVIFKDSLYRKKMGVTKRLFFDMKNYLLLYFFKKESNAFVVESEYAKLKLEKKIPWAKIYHISNTYSNVYNNPLLWESINLPAKEDREFWLIHICANYPHKNLKILPSVISHLKTLDKKRKYKIILSINEDEFELTEDLKEHFAFLGKLTVNQCPSAYMAADALLMNSLIETFSASYPEAMKMQIPILTSDLAFAHDTCKDAAIYFNPQDPKDIANKIIQLASNKLLKEKLINLGIQRVKDFPTSEERAKQYLEICKQLINETNNTRP